MYKKYCGIVSFIFLLVFISSLYVSRYEISEGEMVILLLILTIYFEREALK